jgi:hypothetical protein
MNKGEMHEYLLNDTTLYCCYCGDVKTRHTCCQENHFIAYSEMYPEDQQDLLEYEMEKFNESI